MDARCFCQGILLAAHAVRKRPRCRGPVLQRRHPGVPLRPLPASTDRADDLLWIRVLARSSAPSGEPAWMDTAPFCKLLDRIARLGRARQVAGPPTHGPTLRSDHAEPTVAAG